MLDDALAEVLPPGVGFWVFFVFGRGEDVRRAEVWAETLRYDRPAHEFGNGEELQELVLLWDLGVADVSVDEVEEV